MTQFLTHLFAGGIIGSYFVSSLWSPYSLAVRDNVSSDIRMAGSVVNGFGWGLYVSFQECIKSRASTHMNMLL